MEGDTPKRKQGDKIEVHVDGEWLPCVFMYGPGGESLAANEGGGKMCDACRHVHHRSCLARADRPARGSGEESRWLCPACSLAEKKVRDDPEGAALPANMASLSDTAHAKVLKLVEQSLAARNMCVVEEKLSVFAAA